MPRRPHGASRPAGRAMLVGGKLARTPPSGSSIAAGCTDQPRLAGRQRLRPSAANGHQPGTTCSSGSSSRNDPDAGSFGSFGEHDPKRPRARFASRTISASTPLGGRPAVRAGSQTAWRSRRHRSAMLVGRVDAEVRCQAGQAVRRPGGMSTRPAPRCPGRWSRPAGPVPAGKPRSKLALWATASLPTKRSGQATCRTKAGG